MNYKIYCITGAIFTIILGTVLHFTYDYFQTDFVAIFSAVNESTWEHLKLIYFPVTLFAIAEYFIYGKNTENFFASKVISLLTGMLSIVVIFYTYNGVIGKSPDWINISIFFVSAATSFIVETLLFKKENFRCALPRFAFVIICVICVMFIIFTFITPKIELFKDPITWVYGLNN